MRGFDVNRFVDERTATWTRLEQLLHQIDNRGLASLDLTGARELSRLYRAVSSDLIRARSEQANAAVVDYLNDIVARAYAVIHARAGRNERSVSEFLLRAFPRRFRREWRSIGMAAALLLAGAVTGAIGIHLDPHSRGALIPESHQAHTPGERVGREESTGGNASADQAAAFSGWLFTHNIEVSFVAFALGITFGLGTAAILFYNGVPLGALAMQYHQADLGLFFWAWILPHGIPELTEIAIAGGAGLIVARGLWLPGRRRRRDALATEAANAVALVLGGMPILVLAGVIEGTISQLHEPTLPYAVKLAFAALVGTALFFYLLRSGREPRAVTARSSP